MFTRITAAIIASAAIASLTVPVAAAPVSPEDAWKACVTVNLTTPGRGSDADMFACDAMYVEVTGQSAASLHM